MIRNATEKDIPAILSIYAPYVLNSTATFEYQVPTLEEFTQRFRDITAQFPWLVWEEDGQILGYVYGSRPYARAAYAWCAEPSVYLIPEAHGKKIGTRLYQVMEECLKLQGYHLLYALVTGENLASISFHEKLGYFVRVYFPDCAWKFGRSLGVNWMKNALLPSNIPAVFRLPGRLLCRITKSFPIF
jgi:phosphinothricin acetyltransferase